MGTGLNCKWSFAWSDISEELTTAGHSFKLSTINYLDT